MDPVIIVHGGAAIIAQNRIEGKLTGIKNAVNSGYAVLQNGHAIDAVETAIKNMENNEYFNAGFGSVLNVNGEVEMDASIMNGCDLSAGACAIVKNIQHPISLAQLIRQKSHHVLLASDGATEFASNHGIDIIPTKQLISEYSRQVLEVFIAEGGTIQNREMGGTVGCVAMDKRGNIAAGTSTGGTNGKLNGRIGDTPQIGSGTYADNQIGGVSSTGDGEALIKCCNAFAIIKDMERGMDAMTATKKNILYLTSRTKSAAGSVTISRNGDVGYYFTTKMMPWAYIKNGELHFGFQPNECF